MKKRSLAADTVALLGLALLAAGCTRGEAAQPPSQPPQAPAQAPAAGALPRLVFFLNPNGAPCQMQDRVLQEMGAELKGKVEIVYLRTTEQRDLPEFQKFGIRALPSLVVTDSAGRELRRGTPGIKNADAIRKLVAP